MGAERPAWALVVFASSPVAGQVKTRLIPALGADGAAALHRQLMLRTLDRAHAARGARVELWIAGQRDHRFVQTCGEQYQVPLREQRGADLGQRMAHAFADVLSRSEASGRCVLIGSDCPAQTAQDLEQAACALDTYDVVVQPAHDGGYVLIGLRSERPQLFEAIAWGSDRVLDQTLQRAARLGLTVLRLRAVPDLDTEADLQRAREQGWIDL
jgi:rSAM/selenodomain-associated transferase 1